MNKENCLQQRKEAISHLIKHCRDTSEANSHWCLYINNTKTEMTRCFHSAWQRLAINWRYDTYHDTDAKIRYITIYCDAISKSMLLRIFWWYYNFFFPFFECTKLVITWECDEPQTCEISLFSWSRGISGWTSSAVLDAVQKWTTIEVWPDHHHWGWRWANSPRASAVRRRTC